MPHEKRRDLFRLSLGDQIGQDIWDKWPSISRAAVKWEVDLFDRFVMKVLGGVHDILTLDKVMNEPIELSERSKLLLHNKYIPYRLIVARLAGRRDFESLVTKYNSLPNWGGDQRGKYLGDGDRLIQYLRDEVKPLV